MRNVSLHFMSGRHVQKSIVLAALFLISLGVAMPSVRAHDGEDHGTPAAQGESHENHQSRECTPTGEQQSAADTLVAKTEAALAAYPTPEAAEAAGYEAWSGQGPEEGDSLNGTWHYINREFIRDSVALDPSKIESIIYGRTPDGSVQAIGAMYIMPRGETEPQPGGCLTTWHTHTLGTFTTSEMMHVWTVDFSAGPFAHQGSPFYACEVLGRTGIGSGYLVAGPGCERQPFDSQGWAATAREIASFLGVTPVELRRALTSGETLASFAEDAGIARSELKTFITTLMQERLATLVDDGVLTESQARLLVPRLERRIDRLIDREWTLLEGDEAFPAPSPVAATG